MGLTATSTKQRIELVCTDDPDVTPTDERNQGWILAKDAEVEDGADVIEVRPLNIAQRAEASGAGGQEINGSVVLLAWARLGVKKVNGKGKAHVAEWFEGLQQDVLWQMLGLYVRAVSNGQDPVPRQRSFYAHLWDGDEEKEPEESD